MLVSCKSVSGCCDEDRVQAGVGLDGAYELCVELGQPWLALAIKDKKGVDHIEVSLRAQVQPGRWTAVKMV